MFLSLSVSLSLSPSLFLSLSPFFPFPLYKINKNILGEDFKKASVVIHPEVAHSTEPLSNLPSKCILNDGLNNVVI